MAKEMEIIIRGTDAASPVFDKVARKASSLAEQLRNAGEVADVNPLKKLGKFIGGATDIAGVGTISTNADEARSAAAAALYTKYKAINAELREGTASELRQAKLIGDKAVAVEEYRNALRKIDAAQAEATTGAKIDAFGARVAAGIGGAFLVAKAAGELANAYDKANEKFEKGQIHAGREFFGEFLKGLPLIGNVTEAVEKTMLVVTGTASKIRAINEEAARTQAIVDQRIAARKTVDDTIAKFADVGQTDQQKIVADAKKALDEIAKARAITKGNPELDAKLAAEERAVTEKRNADLAKIANDNYSKRLEERRKFDGEMREAVAQANAAESSLNVARLRDEGRELDASLAEIRSKYDEQRQKLAQDREALRDETGLSMADRVARQTALDRRADAINGGQAEDERKAKQDAQKTTAERIRGIYLDAIRIQADGGDKEAERQLKRLEIAEKYRQKEEEITKALADRSLSPEARASLEAARGTLGASRAAELANAERGQDQTVQGRSIAASSDARFNASALAAKAQVEVFRDQTKYAQATAQNTQSLLKAIQDLATQLAGGPVVG